MTDRSRAAVTAWLYAAATCVMLYASGAAFAARNQVGAVLSSVNVAIFALLAGIHLERWATLKIEEAARASQEEGP